jgi:hypothetical protein
MQNFDLFERLMNWSGNDLTLFEISDCVEIYLEWDPAYKPAVTSLPIPFNSWVDDPPELNDYMLPALRKSVNGPAKPGEPLTRLDHILVE